MGKISRAQSRPEEIANSISHGIGFILSMIALPFLIVVAIRDSDAAGITGAAIFGASMVILYLASAIYHAVPNGRLKVKFGILDHIAIFLLIAGTYTPFTLGILKGGWGWTMFGLVWGIAIVGICFKLLGGMKYKRLSTVIYLLLGWMILIAIKPLVSLMEPAGLVWLSLGGLFYSAGVVFYLLNHIRYAHFIWHLFVLSGTTCHFFAVLWFAW